MADEPGASSRGAAERWSRRLLAAAVAGTFVLVAAAIPLLTLGFDEAWVLLGLRDLVAPQFPDLAIPPIPSHGGLFAMLHLAMLEFSGAAVWMHRLLSAAGLVAIVLAVRWWPARSGAPRAERTLATVVLLGAPGTVVFSASVLGGVVATALAVWALALWDATSNARRVRWIVCGVAAGLAAASRLEWIMLFPALLAWSFADRDGRRDRIVDAFAVCVVGGATFLACLSWITALGPNQGGTLAESVGFGRSLLDYPRVLNRFAIGDGFLPIGVMVLATALAGYVGRGADGKFASWTALVPAGWLIWSAWVVRSPIPHLRYLWPAVASFAIVFGFGLAALHRRGRTENAAAFRVVALLVGAGCVLSGDMRAFRALVLGDSDQLSFEWSRETRMPNYRRFQAVQDQRAAVAYVAANFSESEILPVIGADLPLRLLSGRRAESLSDLIDGEGRAKAPLPPRFVITPGVGTYVQLSPAGFRYVEDHCEIEAQFGQFCFYRVRDAWPGDVRVLIPTVVDSAVQPLAKGIQFNVR